MFRNTAAELELIYEGPSRLEMLSEMIVHAEARKALSFLQPKVFLNSFINSFLDPRYAK